MIKKIALSVFTAVLMWNCSIAPKEIAYGSEACHYCRMTVVDQQHASQLVTKTGKAFSFDAVECLVNYLSDHPGIEAEGLVLVNSLDQPGVLTDAKSASYLISPNLPSPMGANLTAFTSEESATKALDTYSGILYSWESLLTELNR